MTSIRWISCGNERLWIKSPPNLCSPKPWSTKPSLFISWPTWPRGKPAFLLQLLILIFWVFPLCLEKLVVNTPYPCNHPGDFQDLSAPRVMLESWIWNPGMRPSLAGCCCGCCGFPSMQLGQSCDHSWEPNWGLSFPSIERHSGMQGDGSSKQLVGSSWM